jgi:hypothetical protein
VQDRAIHLNVRPQTPATLMARCRDVEISIYMNGETAQHKISIPTTIQTPRFPEGVMKSEFVCDEAKLVLLAIPIFDA